MQIHEIAGKAVRLEKLSEDEALGILNLPDENLPELLDEVFAIRKKYKGMRVGIQLLSNARSGNCTEDCAYCAQGSSAQSEIETYKHIPYDRIAAHGKLVDDKKLSRHCIGLSGISFTDGEIDELCRTIRGLKAASPAAICCSIGFLTREQARRLREAGVDRVNHNLNTSRAHYPAICGTHSYDERLANIKMLQETGFEICCGGIVGLGERATDITAMFFDIQAIHPASVPVNFLIPLKGTALENTGTGCLTPEYCLKVLSLARLLLPQSDIRCAAGREIYLKGREAELFRVVDSIFASGYLTAGGQSVDDAIRLVQECGFEYAVDSADLPHTGQDKNQ
jgi:biotin synthase